MSNRTALQAVMPAMLAHDGWWDGWYRHFDADGTLIDAHKVKTHCEFPDSGDWHYIQHNWLSWENGEKAVYEFGGKLDGERLVWDTDRFNGYCWQTAEDTLMLKLDRIDEPGAYYIEMINIAPDGQSRARTWQWFKDGKPWKRTLCDEWRIETTMITPAILIALQAATAGVGVGQAPPPPASTCDSPVYMVIEGRTLDRARMGQYAAAIAESEIYQKLGGYYINVPRPLEVFEGDVEADYVNLTVRFPCIENARAFWNSKVYQEEIIAIRQEPISAGDYTVTIYAEAPLREDMVGKVGDARFAHDFADPDLPQLEVPVVARMLQNRKNKTEGDAQ